MEVLQLLISGVSLGCVYGLIALGFVLIYKATEMVNFAQGDMMMLGAFIGFTYVNILGLPFFWGALAAVVTMAVFGVVMERLRIAADDRRTAIRCSDGDYRPRIYFACGCRRHLGQ